MILAARIGTLDVDTDIRSPIIGGKVITVLGNIIAALLEKNVRGRNKLTIYLSRFCRGEVDYDRSQFKLEGLVKCTEVLQANLGDLHTLPSMIRTVSSVCSLSRAMRMG